MMHFLTIISNLTGLDIIHDIHYLAGISMSSI